MKKVDGKYEVIKELGAGLSGEVFLVRDPKGRGMALKYLKGWQKGISEAEALESFKREFSILKDLNHPNIARILDFGRDPKGRYYFTSEHVDGADFFQANRDKTAAEIEELVVQALRALEYLHSRRIFHLDIKPANMLVTSDGRLRLIDFGLANEKFGQKIGGTPAYMAPEVIYGEAPDGRADLYSLGVVFYYCLAGGNPFRAPTVLETLNRQKKLIPAPVSKVNPDVPPYLNRILARLLEKRKGERYGFAAHVIRDINLLSGRNYPVETSETLLSYLPEEGAFIGRAGEMARAQELCRHWKGSSKERKALWIRGVKGSGKTRFLKELKYYCQLNDLPVLYVSPGDPPPSRPQSSVLLFDNVDDWRGAKESYEEAWFDFLQGAGRSSFVSILSSTEEITLPLPLLQPLLAPAGLDTIDLPNFSREELRRYLASLTGLEHPPEALVSAIQDRTDGNPLFVSELIRTLIASGLLFDERGRWREATLEDLGVDFSKAQIPETLKGLLKKRYAEENRGAQKILSLLGLLRRPLKAGDLPRLIPGLDLESDLMGLVRRGRILKDIKSGEIVLKNPLWIDLIDEVLSPSEKEDWHDRIAGWLESLGDPVFAEEAARHWGGGTDPEKGVNALAPVVRSLIQKGRGAEAISLLHQIFAKLRKVKDPGARLLIELWMEMGEACLQAEAFDESLNAFRKIRPLLARIRNRDEDIFYKVDIHEKLAGVALKLRRSEEAKADLQAGLALLTDYKDDPIRRMILDNDLGHLWCQEGVLDCAEEIFVRTDRLWRGLKPEDRERVTNNDLGFLYLLKGDAEKAVAALSEQLEFLHRLPRRYPEARCHYNLAEAHFVLKDYDRTIKHYRSCLELAREVRAYDLLLRAYNGLGNVTSHHGEKKNIGKGIDYYLRALAIAQKLDDLSSQSAVHSNLGILYQENGQTEEAEHHLLGAIRILKGMKEKSSYDLMYLARAHLELGSLLRGRREFEIARDHLRDAQSLALEHESLRGLKFWILSEFASLYRDQGRDDTFRSTVKELRKAASGPGEMKKLQELEAASIQKGGNLTSPPAPIENGSQLVTRSLHDESEPAWKGLLKVLRFLNSERDLNYLLKTILHYALEISGADTALLLLAKEDGSLEIRSALSSAVDQDLKTFSTAIAQKVLEEGKAIVTDNAQGDARFSEARSVHLLRLRSVAGLPITAPGQTLGVLYLDTRIQAGGLQDLRGLRGPESLEMLQAFADQAGLALENAKFFEAAEAAKRLLTTRLEKVEESLSIAQLRLQEESARLQTRYSYKNIVTRSKIMRDLFGVLDRITDTSLAVMVLGETGSGKELIARALHYNGPRKSFPFIAVNCGAIPSEIMESELFGHKAGAFTGAAQDKIGLCEAADGGTLFLDEIGELSPSLQVKLLRFLQEKEFRRVGETETRKVDVRIVSATHQDPAARIREGRFREDLYFRLSEIVLSIPPLRERKEDIPLLVERFLEDCRNEMKLAGKFQIEKQLLRRMVDYAWPGNVRELESLVRVACALAEGQVLTAASLPAHSPLAGKGGAKGVVSAGVSSVSIDGVNHYRPGWSWEEYERHFIAQAYRHHHYRAIPSAQALGLTPPTLYKKVRDWNLEDPGNSVYKDDLQYRPGMTMMEFRTKVFQAALAHHGRPYAALRTLGVSQGNFYKVLKT